MRSFVSSSGTDLGVWYSKRHRRWTCVSVHLYHSQLITGVAIFLFTLLCNFWLPGKWKNYVMISRSCQLDQSGRHLLIYYHRPDFFDIKDGEGREFCLSTEHVVARLLQTAVNKTCRCGYNTQQRENVNPMAQRRLCNVGHTVRQKLLRSAILNNWTKIASMRYENI